MRVCVNRKAAMSISTSKVRASVICLHICFTGESHLSHYCVERNAESEAQINIQQHEYNLDLASVKILRESWNGNIPPLNKNVFL